MFKPKCYFVFINLSVVNFTHWIFKCEHQLWVQFSDTCQALLVIFDVYITGTKMLTQIKNNLNTKGDNSSEPEWKAV